MAAVVVYPLIKLKIVFAPRNVAAMRGVVGAIARNPVIVSALAPRRELLIRCLPGSKSGLEPIRPASFKKATIDPVKVIPPTGSCQSLVR